LDVRRLLFVKVKKHLDDDRKHLDDDHKLLDVRRLLFVKVKKHLDDDHKLLDDDHKLLDDDHKLLDDDHKLLQKVKKQIVEPGNYFEFYILNFVLGLCREVGWFYFKICGTKAFKI
jgi:hypothetical protein